MGAARDSSPVQLRPSWARVLALALGFPVFACASFAVDTQLIVDHSPRPHHYPPAGLLAGGIAYLVAVSAFSMVMQRKNRVVLGDGELVVRSGFRTYRVKAADIEAVTLGRAFGSRCVTLWLADGRHRRAGAAGRTQGLFKQHFDRDYRLIGDWWLANRGPDWQPKACGPVSQSVPGDFDWRPAS